jgi:hypothetical protein
MVAAPRAEMEFQGVLLASIAMTLESYPRTQLRIRAELALDGAYRSALPFGFGHLEHRSLPLRQVSRDFVEFFPVFGILLKENLLRLRAPHVVLRFHLLSLLDPRRQFMCKGTHRPLWDTKSQQGSMVYSLCCRGPEPLRSVSCRLGYTVEYLLGPCHRGTTSPFGGRRPPGTPVALGLALFLGFGPPDLSPSLFLSSANKAVVAVGSIPFTTPLPKRGRWPRLRRGHCGQRSQPGRRCQMAGELSEIPCGRISRKIVSEGW